MKRNLTKEFMISYSKHFMLKKKVSWKFGSAWWYSKFKNGFWFATSGIRIK